MYQLPFIAGSNKMVPHFFTDVITVILILKFISYDLTAMACFE